MRKDRCIKLYQKLFLILKIKMYAKKQNNNVMH